MDVAAVHPSRGTAGMARGANTVRSNEGLDDAQRMAACRASSFADAGAAEVSVNGAGYWSAPAGETPVPVNALNLGVHGNEERRQPATLLLQTRAERG